MKIPHDYVRTILENKIIINCVNKKKEFYLKEMGAKRNMIFDRTIWKLKYTAEHKTDLAMKLDKLRNIGFCFAGSAAGWPPAAIFDLLREQGYVNGKIIEIMWGKEGKIIKHER